MTTIEKTYTPNITSQECMATVRNEGALLLRGFVNNEEQGEITHEVLSHELTPVDRSNHTIAEQFDDVGWQFRHSPPHVFALGRRICSIVRPELSPWFINQVRAQLYKPGEAGIEWHRDYKRDLRMIAVASFKASAQFDIELASGEVSWELLPGDLVLMRGSLLNGDYDDRPLHRISAPNSGKRLSIAYRQVADTVPDLSL